MLEYGILLLFVVFVFLVFRRYETRSVGIPFENSSRILFLIAHPDDECMFFSPSIIHFVESKKDVYLLCLSTGNKYGLGNIRKEELKKSCWILGINPSNIMIIDHTHLPDDNSAVWNRRLLRNIILRHVEAWGINMLITFDFGGVSGHRNHRALYNAASSLANQGNLPPNCELYFVKDVSIFRKYLGIFDVPWTLLTSRIVLKSSYDNVLKGKRAMLAHKSQMVWFRRLYLLLSRYMIVNDLRAFKRH